MPSRTSRVLSAAAVAALLVAAPAPASASSLINSEMESHAVVVDLLSSQMSEFVAQLKESHAVHADAEGRMLALKKTQPKRVAAKPTMTSTQGITNGMAVLLGNMANAMMNTAAIAYQNNLLSSGLSLTNATAKIASDLGIVAPAPGYTCLNSTASLSGCVTLFNNLVFNAANNTYSGTNCNNDVTNFQNCLVATIKACPAIVTPAQTPAGTPPAPANPPAPPPPQAPGTNANCTGVTWANQPPTPMAPVAQPPAPLPCNDLETLYGTAAGNLLLNNTAVAAISLSTPNNCSMITTFACVGQVFAASGYCNTSQTLMCNCAKTIYQACGGVAAADKAVPLGKPCPQKCIPYPDTTTNIGQAICGFTPAQYAFQNGAAANKISLAFAMLIAFVFAALRA